MAVKMIGIFDENDIPSNEKQDWLILPDRVWDDYEVMRFCRSTKVKITKYQFRQIMNGNLWVCIDCGDHDGYHLGQLFDNRILKDIIMQENDDIVIECGVESLNALCDMKRIKCGYQAVMVKDLEPEQIQQLQNERDMDKLQNMLNDFFKVDDNPS